MKKVITFNGGLLLLLLATLPVQSNAQSNASSSEDEYAYAYTASKEEIVALTADRVYERGYGYKKKTSATNANQKGYGIIIESSYTNESGNLVTVHATAAGCQSIEEAKKTAWENLKKNNPNSRKALDYKVVAKFENN